MSITQLEKRLLLQDAELTDLRAEWLRLEAKIHDKMMKRHETLLKIKAKKAAEHGQKGITS